MIFPVAPKFDSASTLHDNSAHSGIDITFRGISYTVDALDKNLSKSVDCFVHTTKKPLLKNVSGIFKAGQVTAIMGSSGAGKTTLLNVLAKRVPMTNQEGTLKANDLEYNYENFGDFANYVMQQDILIETLTVRETLRFAANLKLKVSEQEKEEAITELVRNLKLENCLDVVVGGYLLKGISGGEKKRTSIAFELITDPQVILLDEPTSGLDSLTSFVIVRYLSELAKSRNKTVIMTIHQPNSEIFALFDKLFLMVDGRLIYQGPAATATAYFSKEFGLTCPEFHNPADFFMSVTHHELSSNVERYPLYFSSYDRYFGKAIEGEIQGRNREDFQKRKVEVSWTMTYCTLLGRDVKDVLRHPMMIKSRFFQTVFLSIYLGGIYCRFGADYTNAINWQAVTGFLFFLSVSSVFMAYTPVTLVFPQQRSVILKEESGKLYSIWSYFLSRNTVEVPYALIFPALQALILYWFVGLSSTPGQFFTFYLIMLLMNFNGMSAGMLVGSMVKDAKSVSALSPVIMQPFVVFSGFFRNHNGMPGWVNWIQYLSPFKFGFAAFTENEVLGRESNVAQLNFDTDLWVSIVCLAGLGVGYRLLSCFLLWKMKTKIE